MILYYLLIKSRTGQRFLCMDLYEQLTENKITFFISNNEMEDYLRDMEAPKCKDLFITVIDGNEYTSRTALLISHVPN